MPSQYSLEVAGTSHLERGVYKAAMFQDSVELVFIKNGEELKTVSLSAGQTSLGKTLHNAKEKIELICQRLGIKKEELSYDRSSMGKIEKLFYKIIFIKRVFIDLFIPTQWVIVFKKQNEKEWQKIIPDSRVFQADPFIVFHKNQYFIFYEELKFDDNHGYLMVAELDVENGQLINEKVILHLDYHLSYPCIFKENDKFYMIPESAENNCIDLYECISFPYQWQRKQTLIDNIQAVDTTPLKTKSGYYLFTSEVQKGADYNDELSIFKSNDLFNKPFERIYKGPVITDVSNARMGGHFIQKDDDIYRVTQNCGRHYGYQTNINKVLKIEDGYEEIKVATIKPEKGTISFHTYNQAHNIIVGDTEIPRFDLYSFKRLLVPQLKRIFLRKYS